MVHFNSIVNSRNWWSYSLFFISVFDIIKGLWSILVALPILGLVILFLIYISFWHYWVVMVHFHSIGNSMNWWSYSLFMSVADIIEVWWSIFIVLSILGTDGPILFLVRAECVRHRCKKGWNAGTMFPENIWVGRNILKE